MAVAVQLDFEGAVVEQYDEALERLGLLPGGPSPREHLFHFVTEIDGGLRVVDVWQSRESFERFAQSSIIPVADQVGMTGPTSFLFLSTTSLLRDGGGAEPRQLGLRSSGYRVDLPVDASPVLRVLRGNHVIAN